ncbi:N-6 DNA methylase [Photobacterium phosphoreum]|uniref:methylation-associated defense system DNA methyltransferase MAD2 n=1 Tax=Photobacterium phosphoreum TaxID=659 RepID=UPI001E4AB25A|nr:N-6 DNA methylase [Photobacterium phosphoreum]MCD9501970.1 N-6 DNA methylase [Photobacterium phosphoreum]
MTDVNTDTETVADGMLVDYVTGGQVKETPKELVIQRTARAMFHEYHLDIDLMDRQIPIQFEDNGKKKRSKIDIAIFDTAEDKAAKNLNKIKRVIICDKDPKQTKKTAQMRTHAEAKKDLALLESTMRELPNCDWGLWTNGIEFFYVQKTETRFDTEFNPVGDWPLGGDSVGSRDVYSDAQLRIAKEDVLKVTFRRCHNFIHGNEGMSKEIAFWQFLYLIFAKMHDEKYNRPRQFWAGPTEQYTAEGQLKIRKRIEPLFETVKVEYAKFGIFDGSEKLKLSDRALAFMVSELFKYDFGKTEMDVKGAAYQEIVGNNLRGDKGQFFTPRSAIDLMVEIISPKEGESVLDSSCGTGGFLVAALKHVEWTIRKETCKDENFPTDKEWEIVHERLAKYARNNLHGADFDPDLVKATQMNVVMGANEMANIHHLNSLEFPLGYLPGVKEFRDKTKLGSLDIVLTNPPFGADIPVTEEHILEQYELANKWQKTETGGFRITGERKTSVAPEVLFIERCIKWVKPGGRIGIVLPDGILGNPGDEYIRAWIMKNCWVLASVNLPVEAFIVEANVNIQTTLLFLKRKTQAEMDAEEIGGEVEYPVFMAVSEKIGKDRRGNVIFKRQADGEEIWVAKNEVEKIRIGSEIKTRTLSRKTRIIDNDLPDIVEAFFEFRAENSEPGIK